MSRTTHPAQPGSLPAPSPLTTAWLDAFVLAGRLQQGDAPDPSRIPEVCSRIEQSILAEKSRLTGLGVPPTIIDDALLVVVALVDEAASKNRGVREHWRSLQLSLFGHTRAGEEVFRRLQTLRSDPTTPVALLELYERCLRWGLQGRYGAGQDAALATLREGLRLDVHQRRRVRQPPVPELLPPLPEVAPRVPRRVLHPMWALALTLLVLVIVWGALRLRLSNALDETTAQVVRAGELVRTAANAGAGAAPGAAENRVGEKP